MPCIIGRIDRQQKTDIARSLRRYWPIYDSRQLNPVPQQSAENCRHPTGKSLALLWDAVDFSCAEIDFPPSVRTKQSCTDIAHMKFLIGTAFEIFKPEPQKRLLHDFCEHLREYSNILA